MYKEIVLDSIDESIYTEEQFEVIKSNIDEILIVNAFAGTGKTHTLVGFAQARPNARILYLAYNQSIKKEAQNKFKNLPNVTVKTTHGLAYSQYIGNYKERFDKKGMQLTTKIIADYYCDDVDEDNKYSYAFVISGLLKEFVYSDKSMEAFIEHIVDNINKYEEHYMLKMNYFLSKFPFIWNDILENEDLPFEHDFYLKLYQLEEPYLGNYSFILLDEGQDANDCVIDIIIRQESKKVFIGDTFQQIYGWRGASNALEKVKNFGQKYKTLYLTRSFRCSATIAKIADYYLQIANAPKQFVGNPNITDDEAGYKEHAIIARSNIQLFQYAAFNTGESKLFFVGGFNSYNFYDLLDLVKLRYKKDNNEVEIYNPFYKSFESFDDLKTYAEKANDVELLSKIKVSVSVPKLSTEINNMKNRTVTNVKDADFILTTAHKSKGLEWDAITILKGFIDLSVTDKSQIHQEEINLLYVALTRAKKRVETATTLVANIPYTFQDKNDNIINAYLPLNEAF